MTPEELDAIEARVNAATAGPWRFDEWHYIWGKPSQQAMIADLPDAREEHLVRMRGYGAGLPQEANAAFVAHARTDVPKLVAEVRRLQGLLKQAEWSSFDVSCCSDCTGVHEPACPYCRVAKLYGHWPSCPAFSTTGTLR